MDALKQQKIKTLMQQGLNDIFKSRIKLMAIVETVPHAKKNTRHKKSNVVQLYVVD